MELESAVERLYADESLAADVDDTTAKPLLKWAESQLPALIARGEAEFDSAFITLKKLVKSVARLIDARAESDEMERADRVEQIQRFAGELGITVDVSGVSEIAAFSGPEIVAQILTHPAPVEAASLPEPTPGSPMGGAPTQPPAPPAENVAPTPVETPVPPALPESPVEIKPPSAAPVAVAAKNDLQSLFRRFVDRFTPDEPETPDNKE